VVERTWRERIDTYRCSCPGNCGTFVRHGAYEKYLFFTRLPILRLRCRSCRRTHALIPSFSLPGTSLGTVEVEGFIAGRGAGCSRRVAGSLLIERGVSEGYLRRIEKLIYIAIHRAKALFTDLVPQVGEVYRWLREATGGHNRPIIVLNARSIACGYGAMFCSLAVGAGRRTRISGIATSHDNASAVGAPPLLHSG
jgi:hypothetical protein